MKPQNHCVITKTDTMIAKAKITITIAHIGGIFLKSYNFCYATHHVCATDINCA